MRRERVTGAEVGEEKETARRGEELRRRARRGEERKMGSRASIIHTRLPSQPFLSNTSYRGPYRSWTVPLVDRTARGPYRSWTVPLTHHSFRVTLRHTRVGGRDGPDLHRSVVRTRRDRVCLLRMPRDAVHVVFVRPLHRADLSPLRGIVRRGSVTSEAVIAPAGGDDSARAPRHRDGGSIVP